MSAVGTSLTANAREDSYETPVTTGHPSCLGGCVQHDRAWVIDNQVAENRVRFSHPGDGRYWHTLDYIDIGSAAAPIIGVYALGDFVRVVKQDSVWIIQGDTLDSLRLRRLAVVSAPYNNVDQEQTHCFGMGRVWMGTADQGLVSIGPDGSIERHADKLMRPDFPVVDEISYAGDRIWCRSFTDDGTYVMSTLTGAWTFYNFQVRSAHDALLSNGLGGEAESVSRIFALDPLRDLGVVADGDVLGSNPGDDEFAIIELDVPSNFDYTNTPIEVSVRTPWLVAGAPTERKKWGRPRVLVQSMDTQDAGWTIELLKNFEETAAVATSTHTHDVSEDGDFLNLRGPSGGRAEAVSYRLTSDDARIADLAIHAIVPRFRPLRIRR
jgi:hypothetical protein